jgi:release factor glutamine methyltransferase
MIHEIINYAENELRDVSHNPRREVEILLMHLLSCPYWKLYQDDIKISKEKMRKFESFLEKRKKRIPIQYIIGEWEFMGIKLKLNPTVFIPRPETELLVEHFIKEVRISNSQFLILDIGTGSGAIAIAVASFLPNSKVYGVDISKEALKVAKENAKLNKKDIIFLHGNLFEPVSHIKFDGIIANLPYIPKDEISKLEPEVKKEPIIALDGGKDGMKFINKIIDDARNYLKNNGIVALEIGINQAEKIKQKILKMHEYKNLKIIKDFNGIERIVIAQSKGGEK